jgi:hypothetical protein
MQIFFFNIPFLHLSRLLGYLGTKYCITDTIIGSPLTFAFF